MEKRHYTCIVCPQSCKLELIIHNDKTYKVSGNMCKRGYGYAIDEYTNPQRMLTTTVSIEDGLYKNIPVVSDREVDKSKLFHCLKYLYTIKVKAPIRDGDIIVEDILGTGVNILAARDMKKK